MSESRKKADWPIVLALVLPVVLGVLGGYIGGYYWMCVRIQASSDDIGKHVTEETRFYTYDWQAWIFQPGATIQSLLIGVEVDTAKEWSIDT